MCVAAIALASGVGVERYVLAQKPSTPVVHQQKDELPLAQHGELPPQKAEPPKEGMIFVWSPPATGHQSLLCLGVIDGNTIDAAYLVPVRVRIKDIKAPTLDEKGGKEALNALDKHIGGQLRTAQLWGPDPKTGLIVADFWVASEKEGEKGQWLSQILNKK
jgi:hypothetical protein